MRYVVVALAALGACSPQAVEPPANLDVVAPEPAAVRVEKAQLVGGWSFDRTCATEDAMGLMADGKAYFDEWGEGTWDVDADGKLVLTLRELMHGAEEPAEPELMTMTFTPREPVGENLVGSFSSPRADIPAREVNALRCPEAQDP